MTEFFDTRKIRDDQEHWDSLAARVAQTAVARGRRANGLVTFAASTGGWVAATLLVGIAVGIMLIFRIEVSGGSVNKWNEALQPSDNVGATITAASSPPSIGELLLSAAGTGRLP